MKDYLETLNPPQREAVEQIEGPVLIMAGAGSGKTKALTSRIAYMLDSGIRPEEILAITFTNKAAQEMRERVHNLVGPAADRIWMYTFHSFGARFLRREINALPPYTDRYSIYDADDAKMVVKEVLRSMNLDEKQFPVNAVMSRISRAKNSLLTPARFRAEAGNDFYTGKLAEVYEAYDKALKQNNALDFDDLLFKTTELLSNPTIRKRWQDRFHYILIDEYQDTNHAQYLMAKYIAGKAQNICAVGDVDQSIYSWRGADVRNIMDFKKDYPSAKLIKLEQNYRSTQTILNAANAVIKNNTDRPSKRLWTENGTGEKIKLFKSTDEHGEADYIADMMKKEHDENHFAYGDMAVLYRMNAQSRVIEESLVKRGIAYTMVGGTRFYDRAEIRDMLAYLKLLANYKDDVSLRRIINTPKRGIGAATVRKLADFSESRGISMFEGIMASDEMDMANASKMKLQKFIALIMEFLNASTELNVVDLLQKIMDDTGYLKILEESDDPQDESKEANLGELLSVARDFVRSTPEGKLPDFLEKVALVNDVDTYEEQNDRVTLMSIHSAKGLEFPIVFLAGLDEGIFPGVRSLMDENALEEERRLCYVAITRAKKKLYLSTSELRTMYGQIKPYLPSRFLEEIPKDLIEENKQDRGEFTRRQAVRRSDRLSSDWAISDISFKPKRPKGAPQARFDWKVGDKIRHRMWGEGKVIEVSGSGRSMMLKLSFPGNKIRQVMAAYAPLEKEE